ncbi:hypothetical protein SEA_ARACELI_74 [Streptomyces phage Araceli]|nr:hypothetical protein SEA_ARACELI_74 [Streptomyces phage Araceli]
MFLINTAWCKNPECQDEFTPVEYNTAAEYCSWQCEERAAELDEENDYIPSYTRGLTAEELDV